MAGLDRLMEIIARENPYSNGGNDDMDLYLLAPSGIGGLSAAAVDFSRIDVEMANYAGTWDFKDVPQPLSRALRVKYRYRVPNLDLVNPLVPSSDSERWRTDYLLIGFVNGGAG